MRDIFILFAIFMSAAMMSCGSAMQPNGTLTVSVLLTVADEKNAPLVDASLAVGGQEFASDNNGVIAVEAAELNDGRTILNVSRTGYFSQTRIANPASDVGIVQHAVLHKANIVSQFSGTAGDTAYLGKTAVVISPFSLIYLTGTLYPGSANLHCLYFDPLNTGFGLAAPGDMKGKTATGDIHTVHSLGLLRIALSDLGGASLQLKRDLPITVIIPKPTSLWNEIEPAQVRLWSFDDKTGYWMEQGTPEFRDGEFFCRISDPGDWMIGVASESASLTGRASCSENAAASVVVSVGQSIATANSDGYFRASIPAGFEAVVVVERTLNNGLTAPARKVSAQTAGAQATADQPLQYCPATVRGRLTSCDGTPMAGAIVAEVKGMGYARCTAAANGSFSLSAPAGFPIELFCTSLNGKSAKPTTVELPLQSGKTTDVGDVRTCE